MKILVWHLHGGWLNSFLRGDHEYYIPKEAGKHLAFKFENVHEIEFQEFMNLEIDVVVLQQVSEIKATERLLNRKVGTEVAAVYIEHNTPEANPVNTVHPLSDQQHIPIVHVTHFNRLFWDNGTAKTRVIEHGVVDSGYKYKGEIDRLAVVINEPVRRWRMTGTDLLRDFANVAAIDCFGIDTELLPDALKVDHSRINPMGDYKSAELHKQLARRRLYLHPNRWTSLGLSLLEAMTLGMPVIALATTENIRAVPFDAGAISTNILELTREAEILIADHDEAKKRGLVSREVALEKYNLHRFLADWDEVLIEAKDTFSKKNLIRTGRRL